MGAADLLNNLEVHPDGEGERDIWLEIPTSYLPLPVQNAEAALAEAEPTLTELCPPERQDLLYATMNTFAMLLPELEQRNVVYCGLGWHELPDSDEIASSSLVISLQSMGAERNPRLVLGDLVTAAADAGDHAQADLVDLANGPALFFESVRSLKKPTLPGETGDPGYADVYQLEAMVPSEKGDLIAVLEFSTPQVEYGALYREMMVLITNSVSFTPPPGSAQENASARQIHDLLGGSTA